MHTVTGMFKKKSPQNVEPKPDKPAETPAEKLEKFIQDKHKADKTNAELNQHIITAANELSDENAYLRRRVADLVKDKIEADARADFEKSEKEKFQKKLSTETRKKDKAEERAKILTTKLKLVLDETFDPEAEIIVDESVPGMAED